MIDEEENEDSNKEEDCSESSWTFKIAPKNFLHILDIIVYKPRLKVFILPARP